MMTSGLGSSTCLVVAPLVHMINGEFGRRARKTGGRGVRKDERGAWEIRGYDGDTKAMVVVRSVGRGKRRAAGWQSWWGGKLGGTEGGMPRRLEGNTRGAFVGFGFAELQVSER